MGSNPILSGLVLLMGYKKFRYNYFNSLFKNKILLKENQYKYIFVFQIPENFSSDQKKNFKNTLTKSGFFIKTVKVSYLNEFLKSQSVNNDFLSLLQGSVTLGVFCKTELFSISKIFKQDSLVKPLAVFDENGFVFYSAFLNKLDRFTHPSLGSELINLLCLNQIRLVSLLDFYKKSL